MPTKMISDSTFSSTVWGHVNVGESFEVADGYVADLEAQGTAHRATVPAPTKRKTAKVEPPVVDDANGG